MLVEVYSGVIVIEVIPPTGRSLDDAVGVMMYNIASCGLVVSDLITGGGLSLVKS